MTTPPQRASFLDSEDALDVSGFTPKTVPRDAASQEQIRAVSEAAHFQSREPKSLPTSASPGRREPRRYRTGRNTQLNIKARTEAIDAFYTIADKQGWVLGETFERAIEALRRELATEK
jgi:hypothetical protein